MALNRDTYELTQRMRQLEEARPALTPAEAKRDQDKTLALLARHNAMDVAPILGLRT